MTATADKIPMVFLPGMGADARMFEAQRAAFPRLRTLEWKRPGRHESIGAYARRISKALPDGPLVLGGVSFGGVIAQEIAVVRKPAALVLIATLVHPREIRWGLPMARHLPGGVFQIAGSCGPRLGRFSCLLNKTIAGGMFPMTEMIADADPQFLAWAERSVLSWAPSPRAKIPTLRIHGTRDPILRPANRRGIIMIRGAGHLLNMTHADAVNNTIRQFLDHIQPA